MMNHPNKVLPYLCSHDESDPEHLTCIPTQQNDVLETMPYLKKRYHTYYHPKRKNHFFHRIADALLGSAVLIGIAVVFYVQSYGPLFSNALDISIRGDQSSLASGDVITFSLSVTNRSPSRLKNPSLILSLPPHFELIGPSPLLPQSLSPRESVQIEIKGIAIGSSGDRQIIKMSVRAEIEKEGWVAYREQQSSYLIHDTRLDVRADIPSLLIPGNPFSGSLTIENQSSQPLKNILIQLVIPHDIEFVFSKNRDMKQGLSIVSIEAHNQYSIPFTGLLHEFRPRLDPLSVIVSFERDGKRITQRQTEFILTATKPFLELALHADSDEPLIPGKTHTIGLDWQNISSTTLSHIRLSVSLSGYGIDKQSLASPLSGSQKPFELTWTENTLTHLKRLQPNSRGSLAFELTPSVVHALEGLTIDSPLEVVLHCVARYRVGDIEQQSSCTPTSFQLNTIVSLGARARYFSPEGDQIGHGPYPPRATMLTRYMVFITASSSLHPLEQVHVEALLSPDVALPTLLPTTFGNALYNEQKRTVEWDIGTLPSLLADKDQTAGLVLDLPFTPKNTIDSPLILISNITLIGKDAVTGASMRVQAQDVTSTIEEGIQ